MSNILVTGASGFIGSHLHKRLAYEGHAVTPLSHKSLYKEQDRLTKIVKALNPSYIFHLASYGNHYFQTEENKTVAANYMVLNKLLQATKDIEYKAFLNFSTQAYNFDSGSFYGATKAGGEYLVRAYVKQYDLPIVNIRPYSVFGEGEADFRFVPKLCKQIMEGKEITLTNVAHDWIYIDDFIDGLLQVAIDSNKYRGKSVGIGTGIYRNNRYIAKQLQLIIQKEVRIVKEDARSYEGHTNPIPTDEITLTRFAKTPIELALRKVYEYEKQRIEASDC